MSHVLGIDVSKAKIDVALSADNKRFQSGQFKNERSGHKALGQWLQRQKVSELHVCLEATGRYGDEVAHYLYEQGYVVSMVNPWRIHAYGQSKLRRNKNDRIDARLIADFCATQQPEPWIPSSAIQRELQELSREISTLKADRQRKRNKLKSGLSSAKMLHSLERQLDFIEQEIAKLEQEIEQLIDQDSALKQDFELLLSIPAIGPTTAIRFLAEVDVTRFQQAAQVAAYAGLVPREHTSGSSVHKKPHLSNLGNRHLRTAFYMPALAAHRFNPIIQALVARLTERGKSKMTIIGAVMRKLLHLAFGVLKTRKPFDANHPHSIPVGG
ncbi:MAG: transposase [Caldilineaceae bacterium]|nr:transposase [Caldilineaceae bacterium]MCB0124684.1 transposase [Caldilineaceae bacterium]MCB0140292.1 transposase [Caldilineaceae bacterium]